MSIVGIEPDAAATAASRGPRRVSRRDRRLRFPPGSPFDKLKVNYVYALVCLRGQSLKAGLFQPSKSLIILEGNLNKLIEPATKFTRMMFEEIRKVRKGKLEIRVG